MPIDSIVPKKGEVFFILPIGEMTTNALREELRERQLDQEPVNRICSKRGKISVFETPSFLVDYLRTNPTWTNHKFVIYHEIDGVFSLWEPEKGIRRPPFTKGDEKVPVSSFKTPAQKIKGKNLGRKDTT